MFFPSYLNENIYACDFKQVKELKGAIVSELDHLPSQMVGKAFQIQGESMLTNILKASDGISFTGSGTILR